MLAKHNIKSVALPPRIVFSYLPPVKDALGLRTPGIYRIPYESGIVYIGQSGRYIQIEIRDGELGQADLSNKTRSGRPVTSSD